MGALGKAGDIVLPLKDPTSDMAVIARKGSDLVKQVGFKPRFELCGQSSNPTF